MGHIIPFACTTFGHFSKSAQSQFMQLAYTTDYTFLAHPCPQVTQLNFHGMQILPTNFTEIKASHGIIPMTTVTVTLSICAIERCALRKSFFPLAVMSILDNLWSRAKQSTRGIILLRGLNAFMVARLGRHCIVVLDLRGLIKL